MITQKSIKLLQKYWKIGHMQRYHIPIKIKIELKRLGILKYHETKVHYVINKDAYNKLVKGKQMLLDVHEAKK